MCGVFDMLYLPSLCRKFHGFVAPTISCLFVCLFVLCSYSTDTPSFSQHCSETNAYIPHQDYLVDRDTSGKKDPYNYDSAHQGGNRFATVLLYMSDIPEGGGGETVFANTYPPELDESEHQSLSDALAALRATGDAARSGIEEGSWEEEMVATCRSKLSVRPHAGRAVLFYSQYPNGQEDKNARHGGCPVLHGHTKWVSNECTVECLLRRVFAFHSRQG